MTAVIAALGLRRRSDHPLSAATVPPLEARLHLVRTVLVVLFVVSAGLLIELTVFSALQQRAGQQQLFDRFRAQLAEGTAPLGPTDIEDRELALGAPVAYLEVPAIGLRQVVVEGTTSGALMAGPGHRRDTPLPGQAGVSLIFGRRAAFGAPFARLDELEAGSVITTTTGQGRSEYRVVGARRENDLLPLPVPPGGGRLVLATADGRPFLPAGVLRVDADLTTTVPTGPQRLVTNRSLPASEQTMAADTSRLWALTLWLQVLVAVAVAAVWSWHRWGHAQTWVVFVPLIVLVGLLVSNQTALLLPNLL